MTELPIEHVTPLLLQCLEAAVPMWIERLRHETPAHRAALARDTADLLAAAGDTLLHAPQQRRFETRPAHVFNAVATAIAAAAFLPGGVTLFGRHWEVPPMIEPFEYDEPGVL